MMRCVILFLLTACGLDNEVADNQGGGDDSAGQIVADEDSDGYTDDDCDESSAEVNPGAQEVCDGQDNNCNGQIDEEQADGDLDGICDALDECPDDPSNTCNTVVEEVCNGVDDDGDGEVDEGMQDSDEDGICDEIDEPDPVYEDNTTCDGVDNDGDGAEGTPTDLIIDVDPGNGECVVNTSEMFSDAGQYSVEVCDEGAYVACNATDSSASITAVAGVFYPDGCATALATNPSWDALATTCGWVVPE